MAKRERERASHTKLEKETLVKFGSDV